MILAYLQENCPKSPNANKSTEHQVDEESRFYEQYFYFRSGSHGANPTTIKPGLGREQLKIRPLLEHIFDSDWHLRRVVETRNPAMVVVSHDAFAWLLIK